MESEKREKLFSLFPILLLLLTALIVRFFLSPHGTLELDQNTFIAWSNRLVNVGFARFYQSWCDYLPGYLYILGFLAKLSNWLSIPSVILYKFPAIISDILSGWLIYLIVRKIKNKKWGLIAASFYVFNPAILANSSLWGQVDSLTALFSLLAIYLVDINPFLSAFFLSFGTLVKPQAGLAAAVVLFIMLKEKWKTKKIFIYIVFAFLIFILGFVPFSGEQNLVVFILSRIQTGLNQYPYTTINAFNFLGLFGFWQKDNLGLQIAGLIITFTLSLLVLWCSRKVKGGRYFLASMIFISSFFFFTRMHERHLLPAFAFLAIASVLNSRLWIPYLGFSAIYLANLYYSFNWITKDFLSVFSPLVLKIFILFNLGFLFFLFREILVKKSKRFALPLFNQLIKFKKEKKRKDISQVVGRNLLIGLLIFSFLTRVAWLGQPKKEYFDEVYHAFTARRMLHGDPKVWEWWNTPPKGFAYEWTHPPLAKEAMVLGMLVFGENAFGWRIPAALLGVVTVYLVYLLTKELFKDRLLALLASGAFALDGLVLSMSRIAMNDIYFLFFSLLSLYLFLKKENLFSAMALGLAAASKWTVIWMIPVLLISHFSLKRKFTKGYLWFLLVPAAVYLASYLPLFLTGHGWDIFVGLQKQMWWYHSQLEATHPYTSPWWSWPFLLRPVWLYTSGAIRHAVANIYAMGNPLVFWFGVLAIVICLIYAYFEKNKKLALIVFSCFAFFVPWAISPRIMFLYHYLPSMPFLAMVTAYVLRRFSRLAIPFFVLAGIIFLYFYPHWIGLKIPLSLDNSYYWFSSWR